MKRMALFLGILLATVTASAGFQAYNGTTNLNVFDKIQCSTGLTCTRSNGRLVLVSSPTIAGSPVSVTGAEGADGILNVIADESDDNGDDWAIKALATGNGLDFSNNTSGSLVSKMLLSTAGELSGYKSPVVAASATTITAAQCGSTFLSAGAVEMELPEASTVIGCTLTFVVNNASNFTIDPDAADQILLLTDAAGDSLIADAVGESLVLRAVSASAWATVGAEKGTWTDSN